MTPASGSVPVPSRMTVAELPAAGSGMAAIGPAVDLRSLDVLRGLLAMYVVIGHARWLLWAGHERWMMHPHSSWEKVLAYGSGGFRWGHEAVMVFFVLSGFFIHFRAAERLAAGEPARINTSRFLKRRAHRLVPPYFFALIVTVSLDLIGRAFFPTLYAAATGDAVLDGTFSRAGFSAKSVVPALLVLPSMLGHNFGTNGPLWSLAFEVIYYLLYPAWLATRRSSAWLAYGVCPLLFVAPASIGVAGFASLVALHYPIWLAGAALAELVLRGSAATNRAIIYVAAVVVLTCALAPKMPATQIALCVAWGTATVFLFARLPKSLCRFRIHTLLEYFGIRSYTIYICHFPTLALISAWVFARNGERPFSGWLAAGGAAVTLAGCCVCFNLCERHFLHPRLKVHPVKDIAP